MAAITVSDIAQALHAQFHTKRADARRVVNSACASDLMSDVLAFGQPKSILLTGLTSLQSVRTAEVADITAICFVFGKEPGEETVGLAEESNIPLMTTHHGLFVASGLLYRLGLPGIEVAKSTEPAV
jgi:hypothetical protein